MGHGLKALLVCTLCLGTAPTHASAIVPIDTLPGPGDATGSYGTFASGSAWDVAVGFTLPTFGTITSITTSLYGRASFGSFYVGIASNQLIGNATTPDYFNPPPGSLFETSVCSEELIWDLQKSGCDFEPANIRLAGGESLVLNPNLFVASAGTYWVYTRYQRDDVFNTWVTNTSIQTDLLASREGPWETAFLQSSTPYDALGIRVEFAPGKRVPEPGTLVLLSFGLLGLGLTGRRRLN